MATWIIINILSGVNAIDKFPFILLNLMLSWLAGVQAPLIMISQNRQEDLQNEIISDIRQIGRATYEIASVLKDEMKEHTNVLEDLVAELHDKRD